MDSKTLSRSGIMYPRRRVFSSWLAACRCVLLVGLMTALVAGSGCTSRRSTDRSADFLVLPPEVSAQVNAASPVVADVPSTPVNALAQPAPVGGGLSVIRPGLLLDVTVQAAGRVVMEDARRRVSEDRTLTLSLLGVLQVGDETLASLTERLNLLYQDYFVNPQVIVEFARDEAPQGVSPWGHVTVMGRVKQPGRVNIPPTRDLTVSMAIQLAGGFDTSARDTAIRVIRKDPDSAGVTQHTIDLRAVGQRGRIENDIVLQPEDVIYVPELFF